MFGVMFKNIVAHLIAFILGIVVTVAYFSYYGSPPNPQQEGSQSQAQNQKEGHRPPSSR